MSIAQDAPLTLRRCFQECRDPRREHLRAHSLWDIVALTICAMICGCDTIVEVQKYGLNKFDFPSGPGTRWDGTPLDGKTLILLAEQGMGDVVQFMRYATLIPRGSGGKVILECPEGLIEDKTYNS